jgi:hypothetical protein
MIKTSTINITIATFTIVGPKLVPGGKELRVTLILRWALFASLPVSSVHS